MDNNYEFYEIPSKSNKKDIPGYGKYILALDFKVQLGRIIKDRYYQVLDLKERIKYINIVNLLLQYSRLLTRKIKLIFIRLKYKYNYEQVYIGDQYNENDG